MPKPAASPEAERAREAALALYRAARLPEPKVIVTDDPKFFGDKVPTLPEGLDTAFLVLGIIGLLLISTGGFGCLQVLRKGHVVEAYEAFGVAFAIIGFLILLILVVRFADCLKNPFLSEVVRAEILEDVLTTAGVMPTQSNQPNRLLSWNATGMTTPFLDTATGLIARHALDLRRATDGAVLGERHVLLLTAGATSKETAVHPTVPPAAQAMRQARRDVRGVARLNPVEAQELFQKHGVQWCVDLLRLKPFASDSAGSLYDVVLARGRLCWLQVADPATGTDAWISVPNHVTTPREAVAWTYGMAPDGYAPTLEG